MASASVACPLCLHPSFAQTNTMLAAFLNFLQRPLRCPLCEFEAVDQTALILHVVKHLTESMAIPSKSFQYSCKQCNSYQCQDFNELTAHVDSEHPERKFVCSYCCKLFKVQASLTLHVRMAHEKTLKRATTPTSPSTHFQCQHCPKKFTNWNRKLAHEKTHAVRSPEPHRQASGAPSPAESLPVEQDDSKQFACPICEKAFKKEQYLQQHVRTHEAKKWECSVCKKMFTTKEYLRKHARLHTGETPYTCDQCGKTFTFQQSYHKHLLYHSDERPHACEHCHRRFKELSTLHNHQRIHTGEKPYSCDTCGKAFRQRVSYVVHRRIHTGALPYVCPACGKSFRYKVSQRTHKCEGVRNSCAMETAPQADHQPAERQRSDWLERLVNARQETQPQPPAFIETPLAATEMRVNDAEINKQPEKATVNQLFTFQEAKNCYDAMATLDLSQLTLLSLDSELIYPS